MKQLISIIIWLAASCLMSPAAADAGIGRPALNQVRSFAYIIACCESWEQTINAIRNSSLDLLILNYSPGQLITRTANDPLNSKLIIGYIDIGESTPLVTSTYFGGIPPSWFGLPTSGWESLYSVQFWNPQWKAVIHSQIDAQISAGYDGIFLDVVNGNENWLPGNARGNPSFPNATIEMGNLIADIQSYISSKKLNKPFYLIGSPFPELVEKVPNVLSYFDAVFNEVSTYGFAPNDGTSSVINPNYQSWISTLTTLYKGKIVLGNDYPPITNRDAVFTSFSVDINSGWIPSVTTAKQTEKILATGPFAFAATAANSKVIGSTGHLNFISGGAADNAILIGGNAGNYFLGGAGKNTIVGGIDHDTIYAHPASAALKNVLAVRLYATIKNGTTPSASIKINGTIALEATPVTAAAANAKDLHFNIDPYGAITSLEIDVTGTSYIDSNNFSNVGIAEITYNSQSIPLNMGSYSNGAATPTSAYSNVGSVLFPASAFQVASPFRIDTTDVIDGGGGFNTVIYRANVGNYVVGQNLDGTWVVTSGRTAEGPDTLKDIQLLQFTDVQAVLPGRGWNLLGNSTSVIIDVAKSFNDVTKVTSVWKWNAASNKWAFFSPQMTAQALNDHVSKQGYETLSAINTGEGFWVNIQAASVQQIPPGASSPVTAFKATGSKALGKGWSLVSTSESVSPSQFNTSLGNTLISIWAWDNPTGKWYFYAPSLASQGGTVLADYIKTQGYLDFASAGKTLGAGIGFWVNAQ
jgi:uncharacterized protein (TIGR01370 family)